jgi:hypothetical protein
MQQAYAFQPRDPEDAARERDRQIHVFGDGVICETDTRGYAEPGIDLRSSLSSMLRRGSFHYGKGARRCDGDFKSTP